MAAPRPNYGISRIDQPDKKNHGWYVRVTHKGKTTQRYFPDKSCGGKNKALKAAREFRDGLVKKLPKAKQEAVSRPLRKVKKSGVTGVTHVVSSTNGTNTYEYWQAAWEDGLARRKTAKFSISRYGDKKALELAIKARKAAKSGGAKPTKKKAAAKRKAVPKKSAVTKKKAAKKKGGARKKGG
jgi:hypothetical protein